MNGVRDYIVLLLLAGLVGAVFLAGIESGQEFKKECVALGGKPLWNGRHWTCLK